MKQIGRFRVQDSLLACDEKDKDWAAKKVTIFNSIIYLVKTSENGLFFYLNVWLMKSPKNFEKIVILKVWELISLSGVKTHFGEIPLK